MSKITSKSRFSAFFSALMIFLVSSFPGEADAANAGKIGPWIEAGSASSPGLSGFLNICPAAVLWELTPDTYLPEVDSFAASCPGSDIILLPDYSGLGAFSSSDDASSAAQSAWTAASMFQTSNSQNPSRVWIMGPQQSILPPAGMAAGASWQATFWKKLAQSILGTGASMVIPLNPIPGDGMKSIISAVGTQSRVGFSLPAMSSSPCVGDSLDVLRLNAAQLFSDSTASSPALFLAPAGILQTASAEHLLSWSAWLDAAARNADSPAPRAVLLRENASAGFTFSAYGADLSEIAESSVPDKSQWSQLPQCGSGETDAGTDDDGGSASDSGSYPGNIGGGVSHAPPSSCSAAGTSFSESAAFLAALAIALNSVLRCRRKKGL